MELDLENPLSTISTTIPSVFQMEYDHIPSQNRHVEVSIRSEAISLILYFSCNFEYFQCYLAINYLDRFLSTHSVPQGKPWVVRLVAISCVSLALKMRKTELSISDIQHDGGFIFDTQTICRMENLILRALKWRMRSVTPFSFINFFISLFKFKDPPLVQALKARATDIIFKAQNDVKLLELKPSLIAASALLCASHELFPLQFPSFQKAISNCEYVNKDKLNSCYNVMQETAAMDGYESVLENMPSSSTPVNVLDLQSSISLSEEEEEEETTMTSISEARERKRRKICSTFTNQNSVSAFADSAVHYDYR